jgi:hypothetical protein
MVDSRGGQGSRQRRTGARQETRHRAGSNADEGDNLAHSGWLGKGAGWSRDASSTRRALSVRESLDAARDLLAATLSNESYVQSNIFRFVMT